MTISAIATGELARRRLDFSAQIQTIFKVKDFLPVTPKGVIRKTACRYFDVEVQETKELARTSQVTIFNILLFLSYGMNGPVYSK